MLVPEVTFLSASERSALTFTLDEEAMTTQMQKQQQRFYVLFAGLPKTQLAVGEIYLM